MKTEIGMARGALDFEPKNVRAVCNMMLLDHLKHAFRAQHQHCVSGLEGLKYRASVNRLSASLSDPRLNDSFLSHDRYLLSIYSTT